MNKEVVSIAMCTYNGERFLEEQLNSILNQTYKNFELIITDDNSSDKTIEIIKKYQKRDKRIKLYQNKKNLGFIKNFEKAISLCNAKYITLADQDDIWKLNKIKLFLENITDNTLIYSDAILIDKESKELSAELIKSANRNLVKKNCNKAFLLDNCVSGNTLMFKKELLKYILPIPETISYHDIWIAFIASTYGTITYTKESMTYYRRYEEQITHRKSNYLSDKSFSNFYSRRTNIEIFKNTRVHINDLKSFQTLELDNNLSKLISSLIYHYENLNFIFFNKKLYKLLKEEKDNILAITNTNDRNNFIFNLSKGSKYHRNTISLINIYIKYSLKQLRVITKPIRYKIMKR